MVLRSHRNDFPEMYHEYKIVDLESDRGVGNLEELEADILKNGLIYPIVVRSPYKDRPEVLYVQVGRRRVHVAKKNGYTHISAYHRPFKDPDFGNRNKWSIQ